MGAWSLYDLRDSRLIASPPAGLPGDQLAGFVAGSKLSLLCVSRLMSVDVTQIRYYSTLIPRYSKYFFFFIFEFSFCPLWPEWRNFTLWTCRTLLALYVIICDGETSKLFISYDIAAVGTYVYSPFDYSFLWWLLMFFLFYHDSDALVWLKLVSYSVPCNWNPFALLCAESFIPYD